MKDETKKRLDILGKELTVGILVSILTTILTLALFKKINIKEKVKQMSIGSNLKALRIKNNMSQSELAKAVGMTQSMITQLEQDRKILTVPTGKEIARVLKCSMDDFIKNI